MGEAILPDLATEILVPVCAVVGILYAVVQWVVVSKVKLSPEKQKSSADSNNGFTEALIEEEEGINYHGVVQKCADIQSAISEER